MTKISIWASFLNIFEAFGLSVDFHFWRLFRGCMEMCQIIILKCFGALWGFTGDCQESSILYFSDTSRIYTRGSFLPIQAYTMNICTHKCYSLHGRRLPPLARVGSFARLLCSPLSFPVFPRVQSRSLKSFTECHR